ncbi:MAG: ABC transporter permease [Bacteroidales bacterium]|nr:ABC transporter permease [Bacteroidales bacterium]
MNIALFIAKRILFRKSGTKRISKPISYLNVIGIILSFFIMFLAITIATGFKSEITKKICNIAGHIIITSYTTNNTFELPPISIPYNKIQQLKKLKEIKNISPYITKPVILKVKSTLHGIVLKGLSNSYDSSILKSYLIKGRFINLNDTIASNEIIISKKVSQILNIGINEHVIAYFVQNPPRLRKFKVVGIYETMMEEFDNIFAYIDLQHLQKINSWDTNTFSGYEIHLDNFNDLKPISSKIFKIVGNEFYNNNSKLAIQPITERYPYIFDWISLFNTNVWVILILLTIVCSFNIISGLLILILERIHMIGILKALGFLNKKIREIFLYISLAYIIFALFIANIISLVVYYIQDKYHIIKLNKILYYIDYVPLEINPIHLITLNLGFFIIILAVLLVPSTYISKIEPSKSIKIN